MTRVRSFHSSSWHLARNLGRALFVLALGPLCLQALAAPAPAEASAQPPSSSILFAHACDALEAGDLDGAASTLFTLRQTFPERPEPRLLESLLALRRPQPSLRWRDAFIQTWNDIGRPDFRASPLPPEVQEPLATSPEEVWQQELSAEQRFLVAFAIDPDTDQTGALVQQLPVLAPPELLVPIAKYIERDKPPAPVRAQLRAAPHARLAAFSADDSEAMQLRALAPPGGDSRQSALHCPGDSRT